MTRHVADHAKGTGPTARTQAFLKVEREETANSASKELQKKPRGESAARLKKFTQIDRSR